jgi:hypothetical protein
MVFSISAAHMTIPLRLPIDPEAPEVGDGAPIPSDLSKRSPESAHYDDDFEDLEQDAAELPAAQNPGNRVLESKQPRDVSPLSVSPQSETELFTCDNTTGENPQSEEEGGDAEVSVPPPLTVSLRMSHGESTSKKKKNRAR